MIYNAIATRPEILKLKTQICNKPGCHSWDDVVRQLYENDIDGNRQLQTLLELSMIAMRPGERTPLLDIRFHQMVRGIAENELAVEFPNGEPRNLTLHRTSESTWGQEENFLFTLGVCRDCGMPYLLAYSATEDLTRNVGHSPLVRDYSDNYCYIQAFALCCGGDPLHTEMDVTPENQDEQRVLYLNLQNGEYANVPTPGMQQVYWYRHGNERATRFIDKCPNCQSPAAIKKATYGVITPYSTTEEMTRLVLLKEFAESAEEDTEPVIKSKPGAGKKVLAFSDTRSGAAQIAYRFQNIFSRQFLIDIVAKCVKEAQNRYTTIEQAREELARQFRNMQQGGQPLPDAIIEGLINQALAGFVPRLIPPSLSEVSTLLLQKATEQNFLYLLQKTTKDDTDFLPLEECAEICVLSVLRDYARQGVIKAHRVKLSFESPNDLNLDGIRLNGYSPEQKNSFYENIAELLNRLFNYFWRYIEIEELPANWKTTDIDIRPYQIHCYAEQHIHNPAPAGPGGDKYYPDINAFATRRSMEILDNYINEFCPDAPQIPQIAKSGIINYLFAVLQNNMLIHHPKIDGWGLSLNYLRDKLYLYPDINVDSNQGSSYAPLRIEEHTAQLTTKRGRVYQQAFAQGDINILSCSTTFEMGIDVGGVNRVFLTTIPPGTANYKQRAGRAGRRPGAAAFILNYAGPQAQDAYYFSHPDELYGGKVEPPHIYLEKPTFRARHLRAVAMACFLQWMIEQPEYRNGDWWQRRWERAERFFYGYRTGNYDENSKRYEITNLTQPEPIIALLPRWRQSPAAQTACREAISGIADIGDIDPLKVMDDLLFQIGGIEMCNESYPYPLVEENFRKYQELCGPNLLEKDNNLLCESQDPMRQNAIKRMKYRLENLLGWHNNNQFFNTQQKGLMLKHPFDIFSELSIIPKYGFPVDVITLYVGENAPVELSRDLSIGLYEYAPGQTVYADKRAYYSTGFESDDDGVNLRLWECPQCHHFYQQEGNGICPRCGVGVPPLESTQEDKFTKPTKFYSGFQNNDSKEARGTVQQMYCGGIYQGYRLAHDCALVVGESDTQKMRYINAGVKGKGFKHRTKNGENKQLVLYHEVITNIAIWSIPDCVFNVFNDLFSSDSPRRQAALRSVKYAIQTVAARLLNIEERDLSVLVQKLQGPSVPHCTESFILFDNASGGGGMVLPLYNPDAPEIRQIIEGAYDLCANCTCGGTHQPDVNLEPKPLSVYRAELQAGNNVENIRPVVACASCLKMHSNRQEHQNLDRWDAALILRSILDTRPQNDFAQNLPPGYIPYDGNFPLERGRHYCLNNGRCLAYGALDGETLEQNRNQIIGVEE